MRLGILTGGGDCPGLNAVIRAVVLTGSSVHGDDTVGFLDGWKGVLDDHGVELTPERCRDIMPDGGTILGTSRTNPFAFDGGPFGKVFVTGQVSGLGLVQSHTQASPGTGNAAQQIHAAPLQLDQYFNRVAHSRTSPSSAGLSNVLGCAC